MIAKYSGGDAVLRLRQKLTKKDQIEEIQKDIDRAYRNHYNVCINGFEKRSLEKNHPSLIGRIIDENRKNKLHG